MAVDANLLRGKTAEQKAVIKYFLSGCPASFFVMKDDAYDKMVKDKLNGLNLKQRAMGKIGLDEDQLKEIPPVFLHGYNFDSGTYSRVGSDGRLRSSKYDTTWLFFNDTHVYMYYYTMDMTSGSTKEGTEEYFYKDITSFSTSTDTIEVIGPVGCGGKVTKITREYNRFSLVVPGAQFYCSTSGVADADRSVNAMKQKLREKKQA